MSTVSTVLSAEVESPGNRGLSGLVSAVGPSAKRRPSLAPKERWRSAQTLGTALGSGSPLSSPSLPRRLSAETAGASLGRATADLAGLSPREGPAEACPESTVETTERKPAVGRLAGFFFENDKVLCLDITSR